MGHYYDCLTCGEERCICWREKRKDLSLYRVVKSVRLTDEIAVTLTEYTHDKSTTKTLLTISKPALVQSQSCPIEIVIAVLDRLFTCDFPGGIGRVLVARPNELREPGAAVQALRFLLERLGLQVAEAYASPAASITVIGHRESPWKDKVKKLRHDLKLLTLHLDNAHKKDTLDQRAYSYADRII